MKQEWMPIETAPRDGTKILLFQDGEIEVMSWRKIPWDYEEAGWCGEDSGPNPDAVTFYEPTHWMRLPTPPKGE